MNDRHTNQIDEIKEKLKSELGSEFSVKKFNDAILKLGIFPLNWLEAELRRVLKPNKK